MIYLPTIKQLQYLVALHRTRHFGKAAEDCHVTQSTLSAGLRELETLLGVVLVERNRRVVRFTPLGDAVAETAPVPFLVTLIAFAPPALLMGSRMSTSPAPEGGVSASSIKMSRV